MNATDLFTWILNVLIHKIHFVLQHFVLILQIFHNYLCSSCRDNTITISYDNCMHQNTIIIICSVVGGVLLIAVIALVVVLVMKSRNNSGDDDWERPAQLVPLCITKILGGTISGMRQEAGIDSGTMHDSGNSVDEQNYIFPGSMNGGSVLYLVRSTRMTQSCSPTLHYLLSSA